MWKQKLLWLPDQLTYSRIWGTPSIPICAYTSHNSWALWLCVVFGLTDVFDGALARKLGVVSEAGSKWKDPFADYCMGLNVLAGWSITNHEIHGIRIAISVLIALVPTVLKPIKERLLTEESKAYGVIHFLLPHYYLTLVAVFLYIYAWEAYGPWITNLIILPVGLATGRVLALNKQERFANWGRIFRKMKNPVSD